MRNRVLDSHGFTMVELLIALLVVAVAIIGYVGANVATQRHAYELHEKVVAVQDAHRIIEQMRNTAENGTFPENVLAAFPNGTTIEMTALANEQVQINYANTTADPLDVTVTVTWVSYASRSCTIALRTYLTKRSSS